MLIWMVLAYFDLVKSEIVVTNYRVYGKKFLGGTRVDLPLKSISATGIKGKYGVYIGTSAGRIKFAGVENAEEVYKEISKLLNETQSTQTSKMDEMKGDQIIKNDDEIDKIKRYKELLDMGAITQEEFESKKKELLK